MARGSLLATSVVASACIAAPPPDFEPVTQTAPILLLDSASPPVDEFLRDPPGTTISFKVPFVSEDVGEDLLGALHLDYGTPASEFLRASARLPSGVLKDKDRAVEINWRVEPTLTGCHSLTILVSHFSNFDFSNLEPTNKDDVGRVTWWLDVGGLGASVADCPGGAS